MAERPARIELPSSGSRVTLSRGHDSRIYRPERQRQNGAGKCVTLTNGRRDVPLLTTTGDVYIGRSRSPLPARSLPYERAVVHPTTAAVVHPTTAISDVLLTIRKKNFGRGCPPSDFIKFW